jgi:hypothetical protein
MLSLCSVPAALLAKDDQFQHHHVSQIAKAKTAELNPLILEMRLLDNVFKEVVSAVSLSDSSGVIKALESMHGTMEKTHEGVHSGTVKIPKNADKLEEFVKMDKDFHNDLDTLAHAAHENNSKEMADLTKKLLDGCINCHQIFRK